MKVWFMDNYVVFIEVLRGFIIITISVIIIMARSLDLLDVKNKGSKIERVAPVALR